MTDYLESARVLIEFHCDEPEIVTLAGVHALVSIAESLAVLAGDLREERLRTESLRAELGMARLGMARQEAGNAAGVLDAVVEILHSDKPDAHRIKAIAEAVTQ